MIVMTDSNRLDKCQDCGKVDKISNGILIYSYIRGKQFICNECINNSRIKYIGEDKNELGIQNEKPN